MANQRPQTTRQARERSVQDEPNPSESPLARTAPTYPTTDLQERDAPSGIGFVQMFGLDPRIVFLAFLIDSMLFAEEAISGGLLIIISIAAGIIFGFITYRAQKSWYGDTHDSALIKALMLGLLTAIPTPLPALLYGPAGFVGLFHLFRKK